VQKDNKNPLRKMLAKIKINPFPIGVFPRRRKARPDHVAMATCDQVCCPDHLSALFLIDKQFQVVAQPENREGMVAGETSCVCIFCP